MRKFSIDLDGRKGKLIKILSVFISQEDLKQTSFLDIRK